MNYPDMLLKSALVLIIYFSEALLAEASVRLEKGITMDATYEEMRDALVVDEAGTFPGAGLYLVPWKCDAENEDKIKEECKATIRCYPLEEWNGLVLLQCLVQ